MTTPLMKRTDLTKLNNPSKDIGDLEIPSILDDFRPIMMDLDKHDAKTIKNSVSVVSTLGRESKHQQPTSSPLDLMKGTLAEGMFSKKKILFPTEKTNLLKSLKTFNKFFLILVPMPSVLPQSFASYAPTSQDCQEKSKIFSSEKTQQYWERRRKNNESARLSRLNKKNRELELQAKVDMLESENFRLTWEVSMLRNQLWLYQSAMYNQNTTHNAPV